MPFLFQPYFAPFDAFYHRYHSSEERWAMIARKICTIIDSETGKTYIDLAEILKKKKVHVLTTNQDTQFTRIYSEDKISAIQGDWRYFQCDRRCHDELYPSADIVHKLNQNIDENLEVPADLIPHCPKCGSEMEPWVRSYGFLEGEKYREEHEKWQSFVVEHQNEKLLFLELGVGRMTPSIIKFPFWDMTQKQENENLIIMNFEKQDAPEHIRDKSVVGPMSIHWTQKVESFYATSIASSSIC